MHAYVLICQQKQSGRREKRGGTKLDKFTLMFNDMSLDPAHTKKKKHTHTHAHTKKERTLLWMN